VAVMYYTFSTKPHSCHSSDYFSGKDFSSLISASETAPRKNHYFRSLKKAGYKSSHPSLDHLASFTAQASPISTETQNFPVFCSAGAMRPEERGSNPTHTPVTQRPWLAFWLFLLYPGIQTFLFL